MAAQAVRTNDSGREREMDDGLQFAAHWTPVSGSICSEWSSVQGKDKSEGNSDRDLAHHSFSFMIDRKRIRNLSYPYKVQEQMTVNMHELSSAC